MKRASWRLHCNQTPSVRVLHVRSRARGGVDLRSKRATEVASVLLSKQATQSFLRRPLQSAHFRGNYQAVLASPHIQQTPLTCYRHLPEHSWLHVTDCGVCVCEQLHVLVVLTHIPAKRADISHFAISHTGYAPRAV